MKDQSWITLAEATTALAFGEPQIESAYWAAEAERQQEVLRAAIPIEKAAHTAALAVGWPEDWKLDRPNTLGRELIIG